MRLIALILALAGSSIGAPHLQRISNDPLGDSIAPNRGLDDSDVPPVALPGFDGLMRNKSQIQDMVEAVDRVAFSGSCEKMSLGGYGKVGETTLEGRCVDDMEAWWATSLNLNECIGNDGGRLVFREMGNFDATCRPCTLDTTALGNDMLLKCNCLDSSKMPRYTSIEMGSDGVDSIAVKPVNGRLTCGRREGIKSPAF